MEQDFNQAFSAFVIEKCLEINDFVKQQEIIQV